MPELPEVETVVQLLNTLVNEREIANVEVYWDNIIAHPDLDDFSEQVVNEKIIKVDRRGKYIIFNLSNYNLVSHLRMEGKYYIYDEVTKKDKHTHVIFNLKDGGQMHYHDVRKFGKMYLYPKDAEMEVLSNIGFEPWSPDLTAEALMEIAKRRKINIKAFLLDQDVIAGIGNIYVNEILFLAKIHPETICNKLNLEDFDNIIKLTQDVLERAIEAGGTTIRSYTSSLGVTGLFQQSLLVHNRNKEKCTVCGSEIVKIRVAQRGTYVCPKCQIKK